MSTENFRWSSYDASPAHQALQGFLVLDVQHSATQAEELITGIRRYTTGKIKEFSGCGNGYEFECNAEGFLLDCLYPGDNLTPVTLPFPLVLTALEEWAAYCRQ
ncbi:MAG: hypothetical protein CMI06_10200 [Oceanospirillaceae bacterium]|nr:hypothetical protein [Oceanospirillaceae bacterium]